MRFRVWDGEEMHTPEEEYHHYHIGPNGNLRVEQIPDCPSKEEPIIALSEPIDDFEVMWFTGLYGSEGEPIYGDDILEFNNIYNDVRVVVRHGRYKWRVFTGQNPNMNNLPAYSLSHVIKNGGVVIGNVHESPELI